MSIGDGGGDDGAGTVLGSAALVAGAAIGGGFLAVPRATKAMGAAPATLGLVLCWLWLGACAISLAEGAVRSSEAAAARAAEARDVDDEDVVVVEDTGSEGVSVFGVAVEATTPEDERGAPRRVGTRAATAVASACFVLASFTQLGSQFAKCQELLLALCATRGLHHPALPACLVAAAGVSYYGAAFALEPATTRRLAEACTGALILSFGVLLRRVHAASGGVLSLAGDWAAVAPPLGGAPRDAPWAVAVFVQVLSFGDVVGLVSTRLAHAPRKIPRALLLGSGVPLVMASLLAFAAQGLPGADPLGACFAGQHKAAKVANFKGSCLGRFPLFLADFWTSDHLSERSRSMNVVPRTRARGTAKLKRR